jgi:hypothetical protein
MTTEKSLWDQAERLLEFEILKALRDGKWKFDLRGMPVGELFHAVRGRRHGSTRFFNTILRSMHNVGLVYVSGSQRKGEVRVQILDVGEREMKA